MTQYTDKVIAQRLKLEQEEENKKIAWYEARNEYIKTAFKGGIVKTEYSDKRNLSECIVLNVERMSHLKI